MKTNGWYILLLTAFFTFAQNKKEVLFTIDDQSFTSEEFINVYKKNIDLVKDDSQKNIDTYLDLFISYKLKVNKAFQLKLNEKQSFLGEFNTYRSQLAKKYMLDKKVTQKLVDEAYERMTKEVRASHILIKIDQYASPEDTLKIYNKLLEIKTRAEKGEDFGTMAENYSEDPSAKSNKGDLGYFSAFKMVYPFENAAFSTPVNKISMPFRTRFGYHIVKVDAVRPSRGQVTVAHIMLFKKENDTATVKPQDKIYDIYAKLKQGENYETLAGMYSEDKGSAQKGGQLETFGSGDVGVIEFEDQAFALQNPNDISKPFETKYGWHIVKLIQKHPVESYESIENVVKNKVLMDDRSSVIKDHLTDKLEKKYTVKRDDKLYKEVTGLVTDAFYTSEWKVPSDYKNGEKVLFTIDKQKITSINFMDFIVAQQSFKITIKPIQKLVDFLYDKYKKEQLNLYYTENLENEMPEFNDVVKEYKEGILLFDLMTEEVWNKAKKDTIGLKTFYDLNKEKYKWETRYDVKIVSSTNEDIIKKAEKYLIKKKDDIYIKEKLNKNNKVNVMIESGIFEANSKKLPKIYTFTKGISSIMKQGEYYYVVVGKSELPSSVKLLDETKGQVISDYQQFLEKEWIKQLKQESKITINQEVLTQVKKSIK